ncbi:4-aminobutyrate aminotransferase [Mycobacteroides abscessus subsp. massiliense]|nr:4-aminobutyrate aminotransferase [Mycobacteroides abscessus subsp. massiliense]
MDAAHPGGIGGTFSGNPLSCAAALGVFEEIETHDLLRRAADMGEMLLREMRAISAETGLIGDIRGRGAMIAAELVVPGSDSPNREAVTQILKYCQDNGVLVLSAGTYGNVLRFLPPLSMPDELLQEALAVLRDAFRTL